MLAGRGARTALILALAGVLLAPALGGLSWAEGVQGQALAGCPKPEGSLAGPFVPDAKSAEALYRIYEKAVPAVADPRDAPVIIVNDEGDHWSVFRTEAPDRPTRRPRRQGGPPPPPPARFWGGGQMELHIDKCTGAVSNAHYAK